MKRFKPTIWLSFGLVALTLTLALAANALGLLPDGRTAELDSRAKVAEALAVQLAGAANRNDQVTLEETMKQVVERNVDVYSAALRRTNGEIVASSGDHEKFWVALVDGKSTPTHVSVPLVNSQGTQGMIEISFAKLSHGKTFLGLSTSLLWFLLFLTLTGFIGYFWILRRTLNELDPGRVIPERVQKAFDTLSEGVIILDERQRILLANTAFVAMYGLPGGPKIGSKINNLPWRMVDGSAQAGGYPWHTALREGREMREDILSLRNVGGEIHNFKVNATVISNEKGKNIGAIVTFSDMTSLKLSNEGLQKTAQKLRESEEEIARQRREMEYLANHDQLSGCYNKRAFLGRLVPDIEAAREANSPLSVMTLVLDGSENFADDFGPAAEDKLIADVSKILGQILTEPHYLSRSGGAQFRAALVGASEADALKFAQQVYTTLSTKRDLLPSGGAVSVSIGLMALCVDGCSAEEMISRSGQALRVSQNGRFGKITTWSDNLPQVRSSSGESVVPNQEPVQQTKAASPPNRGATSAQQVPSATLSQLQKTMSSDEIIQAAAAAANQTFLDNLNMTVARSARENKPFAVLHLTLVSWDYLREALGDPLCQKLIRRVKQTVVSLLREQDRVLLLGNEGELLIELSDMEEKNDAEWIVQRILRALRAPVEIGGQKLHVSCKMGVAVFPQDGSDAPTLVRNAAVAMRRAAEENPLEGYKYYSPEMTQDSRQRLDIELGIREALQSDEFELFFQPIVDAHSGKLAAAEALLRCNNARLRTVRIDKIVDVAEQSALSAEIDMWVLRRALRHMHQWCDSGLHLPKISINISARQLTNVQFMDHVYEEIKAVRFSPSRVQIEVTETAQLADVEIAAPQLKRLQHLGVQIALDDFGTGQASLTYLQRLHPDVIKIDRSFVTGVTTNHANATLVSAMTVMAHCLGLKVVVEGVEDQEQLEFLRETECDDIQGYLISKPMSGPEMTDWMDYFVQNRGVRNYISDVLPKSQLEVTENQPVQAA